VPACPLRPGQTAEGLVIDADRVTRSAPGGREVASASLVIAADGRASADCRTKAGLRLDQGGARSTILLVSLPAHPALRGRQPAFIVQLGAAAASSVFHGAKDGELRSSAG